MGHSIQLCNETDRKPQLCSIKPGYQTQSPVFGTELHQILTLSSISNFDEEEATIRVDISLKISWNDTRLSLSDDE